MRTAPFVRRALLHAALFCGFAAGPSIAAPVDPVDQLVALVARTDRIQPADTVLARRLRLETIEAAGDPSPAAARAALLAGRVFERIGAYVPAHELYGEAAMSSAALDRPDRAVWAESWIRFGFAALALDRGDSVLVRLERGIEIARAQPQVDSLLLALAWHTRGLHAYRFRSDPIAAREWTEAARATRSRHAGPAHPLTGASILQLGVIANSVADTMTARTNWQSAARIFEAAGGSHDAERAIALGNLGSLLQAQGRYAEARDTYAEVLRIYAITLGPKHPNYAFIQLNVATCYFEDGRLLDAARITEEAAAIDSAAFGPYHREFARIHNLRAGIARRSGRFEEALVHYRLEGAVRDSIYGPGHPSVAQNRYRQALVHADLGDYDAALDLALSAEETGLRQARAILRGLPESEARGYLRRRPQGLELAICLAVADSSRLLEPAQRTRVWNAVMRSRGLALEEQARRRRFAYAARDSLVIADWNAYLEGCRALASALVRGVPGGAAGQATVRRADLALRELERRLATHSGALVEESQLDSMNVERITAGMSDSSALVAYVRFRPVRFGSRAVREFPADALPEEYMAFHRRGGAAATVATSLASTADVDSSILAWRSEMAFAGSGPGDEERARARGQEIVRLLWTPLERDVGPASIVFTVSVSTISLLPFAALPWGTDRYLVEERSFHVLTTERDLGPAVLPSAGRHTRATLLAVGGVDYDKQSPAIVAEAGSALRSSGGKCLRAGSRHYRALPQSMPEIQAVARILAGSPEAVPANTTLLTGAAATEQAFRTLAPGREVLHLATHGVYLNSRCDAGSIESDPATGSMDLSALAMAGANRQAPDIGGDDGMLTAEEVSTLDLSAADWLVLSGCETGVGGVDAWEGVFGLRRAARIAGARSVILSLWPVADDAVRTWMERLYALRFREGARTEACVRGASLAMLEERRRRGLSTHPRWWAAFVAAGDPR